MQFPQRDAMTLPQRTANQAACEWLVQGKWYRFVPPIRATGIPLRKQQPLFDDAEFSRGLYLGFHEDNHVFQGIPSRDSAEQQLTGSERGRMPVCFFNVLFIGGVHVELDTRQS